MQKEFQLIKELFQNRQADRNDVVLGSGDDCAILSVPANQELAVSIDTFVQGVHFPVETKPYDIGWKTVAMSLSDCAAMGAEPAWLTVTATLDQVNKSWLSDFADGLFDCANQYNTQLIGGDLTRGPLSFTSQIHGFVPTGKALLQSGAKVGDTIFVTGHLGDAAHYLATQAPKHEARLNRPTPRIEVGLAIRDLAHSCIDLSDGLVTDLSRLLSQSQVGAEIDLTKIPHNTELDYALYGGDDYELCFTAPIDYQHAIENIASELNTAITPIGMITDGSSLMADDCELKAKGFEHFRE